MNTRTIRKLFFILTTILSSLSYAQENNKCAENIDFLIKTLEEKSPSYKYLVKNKVDFQIKADSIKSIAIKDNNPYNCKEYLQRIMRTIQDGHLQILVKNNLDFSDSTSVNNFLNSEKFNSLPKINIDSLIEHKNPAYIYNSLIDNINIYIFQDSQNHFKGYVKNSDSKFWRKGELILKFTKGNSFYEGVSYTISKDPRYFKTSSLESLIKKFNISKFTREESLIFNRSKQKLSFEIIDNEILYVSIRSFRNLTIEENKEFVEFFEKSVLPNYKKYKNIIFDVRDNPGGAMAYETLLSGVKKIKDPKNIFVLQNRNTASAAELFILHLRGLKPIKTIGENTMGMTSFRDIHQAPFPNNDYVIFLPTKVFDKNYKDLLQYEYIGITPNIELNENENWLFKTVEIIKKSSL